MRSLSATGNSRPVTVVDSSAAFPLDRESGFRLSVSPDRELDDAAAEITREQDYVSMLYRKLDAERESAQRRLSTTLRQTGGTPQARTERDVSTAMYTERLAQLGSVEQGLCFGRLDFEPDSDDETAYIGRLGLFD